MNWVICLVYGQLKSKARYPHVPSASMQKGVGVKNHSLITSLQDFVPGSRLCTVVPQVDALYPQEQGGKAPILAASLGSASPCSQSFF